MTIPYLRVKTAAELESERLRSAQKRHEQSMARLRKAFETDFTGVPCRVYLVSEALSTDFIDITTDPAVLEEFRSEVEGALRSSEWQESSCYSIKVVLNLPRWWSPSHVTLDVMYDEKNPVQSCGKP